MVSTTIRVGYDPNFVPGVSKPTAANTGPLGVSLTPYPASGGPFGNVNSGVLTITTRDAEIHGWDFSCRLDLAAAGVWTHHNHVRGHAGLATPRGLINTLSSAASNCLVEDNELKADFPNIYWQGGVLGHDYTARRNNIWRTVDGFGRYNSTTVKTYLNVVEQYNYVHDLSYFSPDPTHASDVTRTPPLSPVSKTHNDDGQWQGGLNLTCQWNNYEGTCDLLIPSVTGQTLGDINRDSSNPNSSGGYNVFWPSTMASSTLQVTDAANGGVAAVGNLIFEDNWCGTDLKVHASCPSSSIARNKFGRGRSGTDVPQIILTGVGSGLTWSGNVFEDNGAPVQVVIN